MDRMESLLMAREVSSALGMVWTLPHYATIKRFRITDENVTVTLEVFEVKETVRETRFVKRGTRMLSWQLDWTGEYVSGWDYDSLTIWDEDFVPYSDHKVGRIESPKEYRERRVWEGNVYRPGSERTPMDSAYRVTLGYTTDEMTDYWNN